MKLKSVITSKIEVSECGWVQVKNFRLAQALNRTLDLLPGYTIREGEELQFKVCQIDYSRLNAAFSHYFKFKTGEAYNG